MRIYISCDMEGISGVVNSDHVGSQGKDYEKARRWLTGDVNAVIEAALQTGARKVLVNDAHGSMCNILLDELNPKAHLISSRPKPLLMMEGIQDKFDAAVLVGYHARKGTRQAVMDHTFHGQVVYELRINGRILGEIGVSALMAGYYKTPVVLVCGDEATTREAKKTLGRVETVATKRGITRYAAELIHPQQVQTMIKQAAYSAFRNLRRYRPFIIRFPLKFTIQFINPVMADEASLIPGTHRINGLKVAYRARNIIEFCKTSRAMINLAASTLPRVVPI